MMVLPLPAETEDQPPSGGCVLKPKIEINPFFKADQPPSGGCVLKQKPIFTHFLRKNPAAFRRLCVETHKGDQENE